MGDKLVDHVVYFKVKPDVTPELKDAAMSSLRALSTLEGVLQLNAGEAVRCEDGGWTHALHGRFANKAALQAYSDSPEHTKVVEDLKPILDDICAVDWETDSESPASESNIGVVHSVMMKLGEEVEEGQIKEMVDGLTRQVGVIKGLKQVSLGESYAPARAKGFTWGFVATFATTDDLDVYAMDEDHLNVMRLSVFPLVENYTSVDFITGPAPASKI
eukprot:jgi/Mesen1/3146/ME000184S02216